MPLYGVNKKMPFASRSSMFGADCTFCLPTKSTSLRLLDMLVSIGVAKIPHL